MSTHNLRQSDRKNEDLRNIKIIPEVLPHAEGSAQIFYGKTQLICTATVDEKIPKWLHGSKQGWLTAEYSMLPRANFERISRNKSFQGGRSTEISRLIGKSLRSALNLKELGERQIIIDCDVIQADGGTRSAAITGGFIALALALRFLKNQQFIPTFPLKNYVASISIGLQNKDCLVDLNYDEDSCIDTDMNIVMNSRNELVALQGGTEEGSGFSFEEFTKIIEQAKKACQKIFKIQHEVLKDFFPLANGKEKWI